jgi:hypothetical protein
MTTLQPRSSVDIPHIGEMLDAAREALLHHRDQDLIEKITVLKSYFELGQMSPQQDYGPIIRRAARELDAALRRHSKREVHASTQSTTDLLTFIRAQAQVNGTKALK